VAVVIVVGVVVRVCHLAVRMLVRVFLLTAGMRMVVVTIVVAVLVLVDEWFVRMGVIVLAHANSFRPRL
jgi:hypothetical protein